MRKTWHFREPLMFCTKEEFDRYLAWREEQSCQGCGLRWKDRPKNEKGIITDVWLTEGLCWSCWKANLQTPDTNT